MSFSLQTKSFQTDLAIFCGASPVLVAISCRVRAFVSFCKMSITFRSVLLSTFCLFRLGLCI